MGIRGRRHQGALLQALRRGDRKWLSAGNKAIKPSLAARVGKAARAAKNVESVVFLDPAAGVGLCAEYDDGAPHCPLLVRFADRTTRAVEVYIAGGRHSGGRAAQFVKSHT